MTRARVVILVAALWSSLALPLHSDDSHASVTPTLQRSVPVLHVPASLQSSSAIPVIVELTPTLGTTNALLLGSPQLQFLLSRVESNLLQALRIDHATNVYAYHIIPAVSATVSGSQLHALLQQPGVASISLDKWHSLGHSIPAQSTAINLASTSGASIAEPQTVEPESYGLTGADVAHRHGYTGKGVRVAVIDSGLDTGISDLRNLLARDAAGHPLYVDFTNTGYADTVGHGTACTSLIASQGRTVYHGSTKSSVEVFPALTAGAPVYRSQFRLKGMAPGISLMEAKIFDARAPHGGGLDSWIIRAIQWAIDNHADVISESFGGLSLPSDGTDPTAIADEAAVRAGITVVVANGNEGPGVSTVSSPAVAPGVIAVGASTEFRAFGQTGFLAPFRKTVSDNVAAFTSMGPTSDGRSVPNIVAPGAFSWALFPRRKSDDGPSSPPYNVGTFGGTSKATPVTAGAVALVIQAYMRLHSGQKPAPGYVKNVLISSARDLGFPGSQQGSGRLDVWRAIQTMKHIGPSFLAAPESLTASGPVGSLFTRSFMITNTGSTRQNFSFSATSSRFNGSTRWDGETHVTSIRSFAFTVKPGLTRLAATINWSSADRYSFLGANHPIAMRVALYDPAGRFANYSYGIGTGYATTDVAKPLPGNWTVVVSQNGNKDARGVRHYAPRESFTARVDTYVDQHVGTLTPRRLSLAPGQSAAVSYSRSFPSAAGSQQATIRVSGDRTVTLPVVATAFIPVKHGIGTFSGALTGPGNAYFSLDNENDVYSFNMPPHATSVIASVNWSDPGYGVVLLLISPSGQVVNGQFNGLGGSDGSPLDLFAHNLQAFWANPEAGKWQVVIMGAVFSGARSSEKYAGTIVLNSHPATPVALSTSVEPGGSATVPIQLHNGASNNVAEGYVGYGTTDQYSYQLLNSLSGPFGTLRRRSSDSYSYSLGFVPPGTQTIISTFSAHRLAQPVDVVLSDPIGFVRGIGRTVPMTLPNGQPLLDTTAVISSTDMPIGAWSGLVTLQGVSDHAQVGSIIGRNYAYALAPTSWIAFDHGLKKGQITGGQPLILLPGQSGNLSANVTVPLNTTAGSYHTNVFIYTVFGDQVAKIPLTITVQNHVGVEPGP